VARLWLGFVVSLAQLMKSFLISLSLSSGAILVAALSMGVVWLLRSVLSKNLHSLSAAVVPFALAYCLYWSPVWLGSDDVSQYGAWAGLGIGAWFLAGFFPSAMMVLIIQKRRARMNREK
jgi:hypothetical protein